MVRLCLTCPYGQAASDHNVNKGSHKELWLKKKNFLSNITVLSCIAEHKLHCFTFE